MDRPLLLDPDGDRYHRQAVIGPGEGSRPWCKPPGHSARGHAFTGDEHTQYRLERVRCGMCWPNDPYVPPTTPETPVTYPAVDPTVNQNPLDQQPHVVIVWGGDDDRPEVDEVYGPFPDRASAAAVADRTNAYVGHRVTLDVQRLQPPKPDDLPAPQTGPLFCDLLVQSPYEQAKALVLREVDVVSLVASLNPDKMGMGDYQYSPEMRETIRKVQQLVSHVSD